MPTWQPAISSGGWISRRPRAGRFREICQRPMHAFDKWASTVGLVLTFVLGAAAQESKLRIVAAENFYGDVARQIGGSLVEVVSIMNNPDQDPHLFETTPSIVRQVSEAQIVVFNGANYDPRMDKLLSATPRAGRVAINVASLVAKEKGDNPHLWYAPGTIKAVAAALADTFGEIDRAHAADYAARQMVFESTLAPLDRKIEEIRAMYGGAAVTATEPVFNYMASALGLVVRNERFQVAVMNDTEPSAREIAAFEEDLNMQKVKALIFNKQAITNLTKRMLEAARRANIPVVGVTETQPAGVNYRDWMLMQLDELQRALADTSK
jgi:zinc/manganese transport system substrate-binding protein